MATIMDLPTSQTQGAASSQEPAPRSRLSAMQSNVRALLRNPIASSVYSRSPNASAAPTPRVPQLAFLRRGGQQGDNDNNPADEEHQAVLQPTVSASTRRSSSSSRSGRGAIQQGEYVPFSRISLWTESPQAMTVAVGIPSGYEARRHEHPVVVVEEGEEEEHVYMGRHPADVPLDPEAEELAQMVRPKKRRKGCRRCRRGAWVRKKHGRPSLWRSGRTRTKCFCCLISGFLLLLLLTIYLTLALTQVNFAQELHVLFILAIIGATVFFAHSLIRLCMIAWKPDLDSARHRHHHGPNGFPNMVGPEGFQPDQPIRVHLAVDDDLEAEQDAGHVQGDEATGEDKPKVKVPPPAYGLWRSSVRIQPNLLHWARVGDATASEASLPTTTTTTTTTTATATATGIRQGPESPQRESSSGNRNNSDNSNEGARPPSYASDDGVDYVVRAQPRSTVYMPQRRPPSQLHPALRQW